MRQWLAILIGLTAALSAFAQVQIESGNAVVVVYNTDMPGSKEVADHYADKRQVSADRILGLKMTTREAMTRKEYQDQLETPLRQFLDRQQLLVFEPDARSTNSGAVRVKVSKLRYVVLCYGVPTRIAEEPSLVEPGEEKLIKALQRNGAAVDSELALLPSTDPHRMLAGVTINHFYGATNGAMFEPVNGILMVARLDGPTPQIAEGLVDKAMEAESFGLWGRAYFDMRGLAAGDNYKIGDDWIRLAARAAKNYGFDTVVDDKPEMFSAGFPMSQIALYAGWYTSEVSGPFAQPNVEFMPGAFAYHLHSYSAQTIRSTKDKWVGPLLADGATATMGCVDEPYLEGTPNLAIFFTRFLAGFSFGEAAYASQSALSWQVIVVGDPLYRPFGKDPRLLHESLAARDSPMIEWSYERIINLSLNHGVSPYKLIDYLRATGATAHSAVLTEKLGDLYLMQGLTNLAVSSWKHAMELGATPLQTVRLTFNIADQLAASNREGRALDTLDDFMTKNPHYPDALAVYQKMDALAKKLRESEKAGRYEKEIARLTPAK